MIIIITIIIVIIIPTSQKRNLPSSTFYIVEAPRSPAPKAASQAVGDLQQKIGGRFCHQGTDELWYPLVMTNIAMENGLFIDGLPIKNGDFPWLC